MIESGTITANGGQYAAGIGSGFSASCGTITISGGNVTATGGENAAGIGSGFSGFCGDIIITDNATVRATKGESAPYSVGKGADNLSPSTCGTITVGGIELDNIATNPYVYPINLSTLKGDYEAQHGDRLTGTLDRTVSISIAAGATVTLDGITISGSDLINSNQWPGLNCKGDAVIILKEGSTNSVRGYYPTCSSVYVPQGNLLTIRGEGTLRAFGSVHAPGIGSSTTTHPSFKTWHCGTIRIESGTIEALGGWEAPGIGCNGGAGIGSAAGGYGFAGTIHISGGIVTATGGAGNAEPKSKDEYYGAGAGIGSGGSDSSCGTITITNTVTRVTATSGSAGGAQSIGKGADGSTCSTVTIHTTVYADGINTAPFIYPAIP